MGLIAFFGVADHERPVLERAAFGANPVLLSTEQLSPENAARVPEAEVLSVFIYSRVTADVLARLPGLKLVTTRSTGFDHIDVAACRQRGILVSNVPSYGESTVAEHAFALLFALARRLKLAYRKVRDLDFSFTGLQGFDLADKTLGIVGAGRIGRHAIRMGRGFGMRVLAYDPFEDPAAAAREGFTYVALDDLLRESHVVSLHAALTDGTLHLIDREALRKMRPDAVLINTARGGLVDTEALCEALQGGRIGGAGLDVFEGEDLISEEAELLHRPLTVAQMKSLLLVHALLRHDNVVLTPHTAFFTREGVGRLLDTGIDNIRGYLAGTPCNLV
ncbi:MAG: hydroxyacid dehydrogenase [Candidatus Sericytochromatia bacterium]|nr:hydroxyacid dehydrogenase [Candidatus Tanganyikabacteria bacterium]